MNTKIALVCIAAGAFLSPIIFMFGKLFITAVGMIAFIYIALKIWNKLDEREEKRYQALPKEMPHSERMKIAQHATDQEMKILLAEILKELREKQRR